MKIFTECEMKEAWDEWFKGLDKGYCSGNIQYIINDLKEEVMKIERGYDKMGRHTDEFQLFVIVELNKGKYVWEVGDIINYMEENYII